MARKAAVAEPVEEAEDGSEDYEAFKAQVAELRDEQDMDYKAIADQLGVGQGKVILAYMRATVDPADKVKWKDEDDLGAKIVKMRTDQKLSWGVIGVRLDVPESKVRTLFTATSGEEHRGNSIGRGGRHPAEENGNGSTAAKTPRSSAAARKAAASEASDGPAVELPNPKEVPFSDWTLAQLKVRFNGKTTTYQASSGKIEKVVVKNVLKIKDGEMTFSDLDGGRHTITTTSIKSARK